MPPVQNLYGSLAAYRKQILDLRCPGFWLTLVLFGKLLVVSWVYDVRAPRKSAPTRARLPVRLWHLVPLGGGGGAMLYSLKDMHASRYQGLLESDGDTPR